MLRGILKLTWLELKIFVREPMGVVGAVVIPVLMFVVLARLVGPRAAAASRSLPTLVPSQGPLPPLPVSSSSRSTGTRCRIRLRPSSPSRPR